MFFVSTCLLNWVQAWITKVRQSTYFKRTRNYIGGCHKETRIERTWISVLVQTETVQASAMSETCVICDLTAGDIPRWVVHETETVICFLPLEVNAYGHTVIAPKKHYADLYDIPDALLQELAVTAKRLAKHYKQVLGATGVNLLHASGADAGQSVLHFHLHLLPRFAGDGLNAWPELSAVPTDKDELLTLLRV